MVQQQCLFYNYHIQTNYVFFIDVDEYVFPPNHPSFNGNLPNFLDIIGQQVNHSRFTFGSYLADVNVCTDLQDFEYEVRHFLFFQ